MSAPGRASRTLAWCAILALCVGCASGKRERAFGKDFAPRPVDSPVRMTVARHVDPEYYEPLGVDGPSPPPAGILIGWAKGESFRLSDSAEELKAQARKLGGDAVHVRTGRVFIGTVYSGYVYRCRP